MKCYLQQNNFLVIFFEKIGRIDIGQKSSSSVGLNALAIGLILGIFHWSGKLLKIKGTTTREAMCSGTYITNKSGILSYQWNKCFKEISDFSAPLCIAVYNLKVTVLPFSESMNEIMASSLPGLFLTHPSAISLKMIVIW